MALTIYVGNKNYSSWSLRGWLAIAETAIPFEEVVIPMEHGQTPEIRRLSPSGRVPFLDHDGLRVWDSLAIAEYAAELAPALLPSDRAARAHARSISAEMHAGFAALRSALPMNIRRRTTRALTDAVRSDVDRILAIWSEARARHGGGGPFLYGRFSIADAMYAPVAMRFVSYGVELDDEARRYVQALVEQPSMARWIRDAEAEPWRIEAYDAI